MGGRMLIAFAAVLLSAALVGAQRMGSREQGSNLEMYKSLFALKRREHIETAEKVWSIEDYSRQYQTITYLLETLFPILIKSKVAIAGAGYTPNSPLPEEEEVKEAVSQVYENVIFFGDFLLRMPDMTKQIYRKHKEWQPVLQWAMEFCSQSTEIFSGPHAKQLHLMAQEIGLIPEEANYVNPFRMQRGKPLPEDQAQKTKPKREMKKQRGPKLRTGRHSEL